MKKAWLLALTLTSLTLAAAQRRSGTRLTVAVQPGQACDTITVSLVSRAVPLQATWDVKEAGPMGLRLPPGTDVSLSATCTRGGQLIGIGLAALRVPAKDQQVAIGYGEADWTLWSGQMPGISTY